MTTQGGIYRAVTSGFAVGDRVALTCQLYSDNPALVVGVFAQARGASGPLGDPFDLAPAHNLSGSVWNGKIFRAEYNVPAGTTQFNVTIQFGLGALAVDATMGVERLSLSKVPS